MPTEERYTPPLVRLMLGRDGDFKRVRSLLKPWVCTFVLLGGLLLFVTRSLGPTFGILVGPYAGANLRDWQSCCAENSIAIAPHAFAGMFLALLIQFFLSRTEDSPSVIGRLAAWAAPLVWFLSAILSYGHALE